MYCFVLFFFILYGIFRCIFTVIVKNGRQEEITKKKPEIVDH